MTIADMFGQSAILSLLGMAVVFAFLIILIIAVDLVAKLIRAAGWDDDVRPAAAASAANPDSAVAAAISAAVSEHRKTNA